MKIEIVGEIVTRSPPDKDDPYCVESEVLNAIASADPKEEIELKIDSLGGSLTAGLSIYRALKNHPGKVTAKVESYACSAASMIMCAADYVELYKNSLVMIHGVQVTQTANAGNIKLLEESIESIDSAIAEIYKNRTGESIETIRSWMLDEKWMGGKDAVALGFADAFREENLEAPAEMKAKADPLSPAEMEALMKNIEDIGKELAAKCEEKNKKCSGENEDTPEDPKKNEQAGSESEIRKEDKKPSAENDDDPATDDAPDSSDKEDNPDETEDLENPDDSSDKNDSENSDEKKKVPFQNSADLIAAERKRIQEIDAIAHMVSDKKLLNDAKYGKHPMTAQELAYKVMLETSRNGKKFLQNWVADQKDSGVNEVVSGPTADSKTAKAESQLRSMSHAIELMNAERK